MSLTWNSSKASRRSSRAISVEIASSGSSWPESVRMRAWISRMNSWKCTRRLRRWRETLKNASIMSDLPRPTPPWMYIPRGGLRPAPRLVTRRFNFPWRYWRYSSSCSNRRCSSCTTFSCSLSVSKSPRWLKCQYHSSGPEKSAASKSSSYALSGASKGSAFCIGRSIMRPVFHDRPCEEHAHHRHQDPHRPVTAAALQVVGDENLALLERVGHHTVRRTLLVPARPEDRLPFGLEAAAVRELAVAGDLERDVDEPAVHA